MKLYLPHREVTLDTSLPFPERNNEIYRILDEEIEFQALKMSVEEYFRLTWDKPHTKVSLDIIGYYLTKGNFGGEDREILSNVKQKEMRKGSKRHTTFSAMSYENQMSIGIKDFDDSNFN